MSAPDSNIVNAHRLWVFYDRDGEFVTHDRFATSVEAEAFALEQNLLPWMPPISAVGWGDVLDSDRPKHSSISDAAWSAAAAPSVRLRK